jgi:hypothetical protein
MFDPLLPPGLHHYWKGDFVREMSEPYITEHLKFGPSIPTVNSVVHQYPMDGVVHDVSADATAFAYRDVKFVDVIAAVTPDPAALPAYRTWGPQLLPGTASVICGRRIRQLPDGRRRRADRKQFFRELQSTGCRQGEIRSSQLLPGEPKHQASSRVDSANVGVNVWEPDVFAFLNEGEHVRRLKVLQHEAVVAGRVSSNPATHGCVNTQS